MAKLGRFPGDPCTGGFRAGGLLLLRLGLMVGLATGAALAEGGSTGSGSDASGSGAAPAVRAARTATTTTLAEPSKTQTVYGEPLVLTATVATDSGVPTGNVDFKDGATLLKRVPLVGNAAEFDLRKLPVGSYSVTATYRGSAAHSASTSAPRTQIITAAEVEMSLVPVPAYILPGTRITFDTTISVKPPSMAKPVGSVRLYTGATTIAAADLSNGRAIIRTVPRQTVTSYQVRFANLPNFTVAEFRHTVYSGYVTRAAWSVGGAAGTQTAPAVVALPDGAVAAFLNDAGSGRAVRTQRFGADGGRIGPPTTVAPAGVDVTEPAVAALEGGGYVVVWSARDAATRSLAVFGRLYDPAGAPRGPAFRLNPGSAANEIHPRVSHTISGGFVAVWADSKIDGSQWGIALRRFRSDGSPEAAEQRVNTTTFADQNKPDITTLGNGTHVVVWGAFDQLPGAQRFSASGQPIGGEFSVPFRYEPYLLQNVAVGPLAGSGFIIAFELTRGPGTAKRAVWIQRFKPDGTPTGSEETVDGGSFDSQSQPALALLANGRAAIAWTGPDPYGNGIYGRFMDNNLTWKSDAFRISLTLDRQELRPAIAALPGGRSWIAVWESNTAAGEKDLNYTVLRGP